MASTLTKMVRLNRNSIRANAYAPSTAMTMVSTVAPPDSITELSSDRPNWNAKPDWDPVTPNSCW